MNTTARVIRRTIVLGLCAIGLGGCMTFRMNDRELERRMRDEGPVTIRHTTVEGRPIRYVESGIPTGRLVLLIHGAPGSLDDFLEYVSDPSLQQAGRLVALDRPGYGFSGFGAPLESMRAHARIAMRLLDEIRRPGERVLVVGHSYGGTVALRMAVDYPGRVDRYLLLAASMSAEDEPYFWFNRPVSWPVLNWAVPRAWRVANAEKLAQRDNLRAIRARLDRIADPTLVLHGTDDRLIPVSHARFISAATQDPPVDVEIIDGAGHLLIWRRYDMVRRVMLDTLAAL